ncbi:MAG: MFS transporter [Limisphaerales bacterium]
MSHRDLKIGYYVLEGLNAFATAFYFNYLFFFMQERFGFTNLDNLSLCAFNGLVYMFAAWFGGRFAQRFGYFFALKLGFGGMAIVLAVGSQLASAAGEVATLLGWSVSVCLTWPTLEALVSEKESPHRLPRTVGIYNMVWAASSAVAYFLGGALLEKLGAWSLFAIPVGIHLTQLCLVGWLQKKSAEANASALPATVRAGAASLLELNPRPIARARMFLRMAWLANPFAYVAINTVIAIIPGLARRLGLSPMLAGFFCSVWFFARLGSFVALRLWPGWHYRRPWFFSAYGLMMMGFVGILLASEVWIILVAQIIFGAAVGLIYYSSLYYSMDVGEAKGEHGGIHEAAIGAGIFAGPAVGAVSLHFFPNAAHSAMWAVAGLLLCGGAVLVGIQRRSAG